MIIQSKRQRIAIAMPNFKYIMYPLNHSYDVKWGLPTSLLLFHVNIILIGATWLELSWRRGQSPAGRSAYRSTARTQR